MEPQEIERARVAHLMALMAARVGTALCALVDEFGPRLEASVRRHLRDFGRRDVLADRSQLDDLVLAAALVLFDRAAAWDPHGGAAPWTWADRAIRAEVVRSIGHPAGELDPHRFETPEPPAPCGRTGGLDGAYGTGELDALAALDERVALLRDAIATVGTPRDQAVHIQYRLQKRLGDASPAHTVAAEFGLAPDNVRQIDHRMRRNIRRLAERDDRYVPLLGIPWLAA